MNKLTDAEIVKAFAICNNMDDGVCRKCPCYTKNGGCFGYSLNEEIYDLIKRQQAEIERLTVENKSIRYCYEQAKLYLDKLAESCETNCKKFNMITRAEAIKELREKCNEHQDFHRGDDGVFRGWIAMENLDKIIDEM